MKSLDYQRALKAQLTNTCCSQWMTESYRHQQKPLDMKPEGLGLWLLVIETFRHGSNAWAPTFIKAGYAFGLKLILFGAQSRL
jgi:hypothetical protein